MKTQNFSLTINNPCGENWDGMTPQSNGRFCNSCQKVVVDFSNMSTERISEYFRNNTGKVCGQFKKSQINVKHSVQYRSPYSFNTAFMRISLAGILTFGAINLSGQHSETAVNKVQTDNCGKKTGNNDDVKLQGQVMVRGSVAKAETKVLKIVLKDEKTGKIITNGSITVGTAATPFKAAKDGTVTIAYTPVSDQKETEIHISAPGYQASTQRLSTTKNSGILYFSLKEHEVMMKGEVMYKPHN